jgi:hypothetical protein
VKAELQEILDTYKAINPEYRIETLHRLQRLIPTAQALVQETGDKALREIVASIAAQVASTYLASTGASPAGLILESSVRFSSRGPAILHRSSHIEIRSI